MSTTTQPRSTRPYLRRTRLVLLCFSVGANALCAGGVFCFPIISPALAEHWKLTQPQLTTIALAGMMGQYPFSAFVGKILDHYGAWACSLIAACLFSAGFGLFANEISKSPDVITQSSISIFRNLVIFFFIGALGTVFSYFSSVFAASKNFPNYIGIAAGTSMALLGLSPTFLSILASRYFSSSNGDINIIQFLQFLAILCGCVHLVGGFTLHIIPSVPEEELKSATLASDPEVPNERTTLLSNRTNGNDNEHDQVQDDVVSVSDESKDSKNSTLDVLSDHTFWALVFIAFVVLGSCEMIISNIGTIVLSLPNQTSIIHSFVDSPSTVLMTATQVRMLSLANTLSRLITGALADIVSPVPSRAIDSNRGFLKKHRISRVSFLTLSAGVLVGTYSWMVVGVREQVGIWVLRYVPPSPFIPQLDLTMYGTICDSIGAGLAYGCAFTILPSLVSSIWGLQNVGRNFGMLTYAPFLGTPVFSYLYAFIAAAHISDSGSESSQDGACHGPACWTLTFEVNALAAALAFGASVYLWRAWKGRV
ncbi:MFS general substrate transporter [Lanmaoa asiatica]|nr:MFS general substrate transporter [Lanmaoa asiatica]